MSDEMAVTDNGAGEETKINSDEAEVAGAGDAAEVIPELPIASPIPELEDTPMIDEDIGDEPPELENVAEEAPGPLADALKADNKLEYEVELLFGGPASSELKTEPEVKVEPEVKPDINAEDIKTELENADLEEKLEILDQVNVKVEQDEDSKRGVKRRASAAFSDAGDEFKGFIVADAAEVSMKYNQVLERLEEEVLTAKNILPLRQVMGTPIAPVRASKRQRKDTDGSRPSSGLSSRSEGEGYSEIQVSPAVRGGRRATTEMSSPALRVPLERGWRRELVYRAALDQHSRRNADIYYYTPHGKKLRSTREVAEHLSGTGLTLENFSFFKEPLGVDDPEKEIIRDAKMIRRVESPVSSPAPAAAAEGKRTPKPKPPKGASPEPATPKSPPAKIKVKSMGARLSGSGAPAASASPTNKQQKKPQTPAADNNNTAAWKKPRAVPSAPVTSAPVAPGLVAPATVTPAPVAPATVAPVVLAPAPVAPVVLAPATVAPVVLAPVTVAPAVVAPVVPPPPLQSRPPVQTSPEVKPRRQVVQPCSMMCGSGVVPSLACAACLCLYHPACAQPNVPPPYNFNQPFYCLNCRKTPSPPPSPPPLTHKSGLTTPATNATATAALSPAMTPAPRRVPGPLPIPVPIPVPVPVPVPAKKNDKRVLLRMKVAGGGADGSRVWAVAAPRAAAPPAPAPAAVPAAGRPHQHRGTLPQSLAVLNGRRFIVVPRAPPLHQLEEKRPVRGRVANGAAVAVTPPACGSPRRRGRPRADDTDHFTAFYNKAQERNYNVVVQIFQYLGMRELAHAARVCTLWRRLAAAPPLWRHVRMKNSHVSDWGGLCTALKKHGTKRLDLRKMLLPQNDTVFWEQFAQHISTVDTLERIEMCRCPARAVEAVCRGVPGLRSLSALAIRDALLDPAPLAALPLLHELRLKSMAGLSLTRDLRHLAALTGLHHLSLTSIKELGWCAGELRLKSMAGLSLTRDLRHLAALTGLHHLSLTSIKELGWCAGEVIGSLPHLESLELGECTFLAELAGAVARLARLRRLRLERGTATCAAPAVLRALAALPLLTSLELVNVDVKVGFDDALAECKNIQRLLIIPTYVSQSATTNKQVLSGVLRLKDTLTHLMWGVTIELLRVTELFIDQCEQGGDTKKRDIGECIPVLKPVPGCKLPDEHHHVAGPPQVEILPLPTLQRLLSAQLPNTKLKLLRIPFHATWRQSLADFQ